MARFDVFENPEGSGWLVDVQSDLLHGLDTRVVIPLLKPDEVPPPIKRLHPIFDIGGESAVMATHLVSAVPESILKTPVANFSVHRDRITAALDMLYLGF